MDAAGEKPRTLGHHIASRLVEVGVQDFFTVPGDFNLVLLDQLIDEQRLTMVGCCNELNAGYAADGYARVKVPIHPPPTPMLAAGDLLGFARRHMRSPHASAIRPAGVASPTAQSATGTLQCVVALPLGLAALQIVNQVQTAHACWQGIGCVVVTFTVGGLSVINAIAGAYSENLPVICIVGGPNSNDFGTNRILHHTIGLPDFSQEFRCFQQVTSHQVVISNLEDAHAQVDHAIAVAVKESKPVYISVSCNIAGLPHASFRTQPVPYALTKRSSNQESLEAAVNIAASFLNAAKKPVLVGGSKMRCSQAQDAFLQLADASGYPVAVMPAAKGLFSEEHQHFIGTYWGAISTPFCVEIVESADAYLFAGPIFNDYSECLLAITHPFLEQVKRAFAGLLRAFHSRLINTSFSKLSKSSGSVSSQVTCQDVSTMIKNNQRTIIFLINNGGYTIEVEIHDGPYNVVKNWNYAGVIDAFCNGEGKCWTAQVRTEQQLVDSIKTAQEKADHLCFIEVICHKDDTSRDLLEWGSRVSAANSRPPNPQHQADTGLFHGSEEWSEGQCPCPSKGQGPSQCQRARVYPDATARPLARASLRRQTVAHAVARHPFVYSGSLASVDPQQLSRLWEATLHVQRSPQKILTAMKHSYAFVIVLAEESGSAGPAAARKVVDRMPPLTASSQQYDPSRAVCLSCFLIEVQVLDRQDMKRKGPTGFAVFPPPSARRFFWHLGFRNDRKYNIMAYKVVDGNKGHTEAVGVSFAAPKIGSTLQVESEPAMGVLDASAVSVHTQADDGRVSDAFETLTLDSTHSSGIS
eukprot:SM000082S22827  [mRNA]  locus=s82:82324:89962:- [translate_table: standard]